MKIENYNDVKQRLLDIVINLATEVAQLRQLIDALQVKDETKMSAEETGQSPKLK